jgi:hypothetical protein
LQPREDEVLLVAGVLAQDRGGPAQQLVTRRSGGGPVQVAEQRVDLLVLLLVAQGDLLTVRQGGAHDRPQHGLLA